MRYAKFAVPILMFLMAVPSADAAWFKRDSKKTDKAKTEIKQVVPKQGQLVSQQAQKKMLTTTNPLPQKQAVVSNASVAENPGFIDMDLSSGAPKLVDKDSGDQAKVSRLEAEEFEKKKKEIEALMASVNSAKGVTSIAASRAAQSMGAIPHKETYAPVKGGQGLTVELGALPKSTLSGAGSVSAPQKPSVPAEIVKS